MVYFGFCVCLPPVRICTNNVRFSREFCKRMADSMDAGVVVGVSETLATYFS